MEGRMVEERIQLLEDKEAIRELCCRYCHYADAREWDRFVEECFTDDVFFQRTPYVYRGKESIKSLMEPLKFTMLCHMVTNIVTEVDGNKATGQCYFMFLGTFPMEDGRDEIIGVGMYSDEYRKEEDKWKISSRIISHKFMSPLKQGWANQPILDTIKRSAGY